MFGVMMCVTASAAVISSMMAFASSSSTHEILLRAALAQTVMMVEPMAPFTRATQPSRRGSWRGSFVTETVSHCCQIAASRDGTAGTDPVSSLAAKWCGSSGIENRVLRYSSSFSGGRGHRFPTGRSRRSGRGQHVDGRAFGDLNDLEPPPLRVHSLRMGAIDVWLGELEHGQAETHSRTRHQREALPGLRRIGRYQRQPTGGARASSIFPPMRGMRWQGTHCDRRRVR